MIKSVLTGFALLCTTIILAQDSNFSASNGPPQEQDPVIVEAPLANSTNAVLGDNTSATGNYTVAIGNGAFADMDNTMVLGGDSYENRVSVGIGTSNPNSLSSLDLADIDKGLLVNRLTSKQAEMFEMALGIPDEGMMIYNTTLHSLQTWDGLKWENVQPSDFNLADHQLKINDGPSVDLSQYQQDLTNATLDGRQLTIEIENGSDVTVDLSPLFQEYEDRLAAIEKMLSEKDVAGTNVAKVIEEDDLLEIEVEAELSQNAPNPFSTKTMVKYNIPEGCTSAYLLVLNSAGKIMSNEMVSPRAGNGEKIIQANGMAPGVYYLSLYINREKTKTVTMVIK